MPGLYIFFLFKLRLYDLMNNLKVMQALKCHSCIGTGFVYAEKYNYSPVALLRKDCAVNSSHTKSDQNACRDLKSL